MPYKFEQLEVRQLALEYIDAIYAVADKLPRAEDFNLKSQVVRAATSVALNIAEGSTGQTDAEQARFLAMAIRSLVETVACQHLIKRRRYLDDETAIDEAYYKSELLARKMQAFRRSLLSKRGQVREEIAAYLVDES